MTPELKEQWLAALRSGEYGKTTGVLRADSDEDGYLAAPKFCCLGVLCELLPTVERSSTGYQYEGHFIDNDLFLRSADLETSLALLNDIQLSEAAQCELIRANDSSATFAEVIEYIEENL